MTKIELLERANAGYPDGLLGNYYDHQTGEPIEGSGDLLAKFIVVELSESFDPIASDASQLGTAADSIQDAIDRLGEVIFAMCGNHQPNIGAVTMANRIPQTPCGFERQWKRCRQCSMVFYYDFVPYSISHPIFTLPCGHGAGLNDLGCDDLTADEALVALAQQWSAGNQEGRS